MDVVTLLANRLQLHDTMRAPQHLIDDANEVRLSTDSADAFARLTFQSYFCIENKNYYERNNENKTPGQAIQQYCANLT